ncbi:MAG: 3-isopropylmalate dehydratase small subunit [Candidatus Hydrogenedentes bacterium]|nr:3-isopropylmalate dehydratase small subunit [Candidatus Hydrogenedentota bacterium]
MEKFTVHTGIVALLDARNVDTDQIVPKQFLKRIERTGYGDVLFYDWRYLDDGKTINPNFEMNAPRYRGASILLTRDNFGCGSSREHAPWALRDYGFRAIIAVSFADIFYNNCFNNGILPITLSEEKIEGLFNEVRMNEGYKLTIDLEKQIIIKPDETIIEFAIHPFLKKRLLNGWDHIDLTLRYEKYIAEFEKKHPLPL